MKVVSKSEFYSHFMDKLHITTDVVGNWPFEWHVKQDGRLIAKNVEVLAPDEAEEITTTQYYII